MNRTRPNTLALLVLVGIPVGSSACIDTGLSKYDTPPTAEILAPSDDDGTPSLVAGFPVALSGIVSDEQTDPAALAVVWSTSMDPQPIAVPTTPEGTTTGTWIPESPGPVEITLTATGDAATGEDTVTVNVLANQPPDVSWVSPVTNSVFLVGEWPELVAQATDDEDSQDLSLAWTVDGALIAECTSPAGSDGQATCTPGSLPDGDLSICLEATDSVGQVGADCAAISIVTCLVENWYADADADGYGDPDEVTVACDQPEGTVDNNDDCNDDPGAGGASASPVEDESCDGIDNDCDGDVDEDGDVVDGSSWYADNDSDGFGDLAAPLEACDQPVGYTADSSDCDDSDDDVNPAAAEVCDGVDNDCDGTVDAGATDAGTWYADTDGDGFGDPATAAASCTAPAGYVADATDCDDGATAVNPAATEVCDGVDNDCDGVTDDASSADASTWYADADSDTFGDVSATQVACTQPANYVGDSDDCDDTRSDVNPDATEFCDGVDDDCDGATDEDDAADTTTYYADADSDTFGDASVTHDACSAPAGYVADDTDCDDAATAVNPAATELCDSIDNDCDTLVDEGSPPDSTTWYADADSDAYGDASVTERACNPSAGFVGDDTDCDDGNSAVNPGATEACNGIDDDCDTLVDESGATGETTFYADADNDTYGDPSSPDLACSASTGWVADATDCDDGDGDIHPGATELCDGLDNDCDSLVDEGETPDGTTWYADLDGDGWGDASNTTSTCEEPAGYVCDSGDCDDSDSDVNPDEPERVCNSIDDDCDGTVETFDAEVPGDYSSISAAVAGVRTGDAICVRAGTWNDSVYITKSLTLEGEDMATTIIDAQSLDRGIDLRGFTGAATVRGFTIERGMSQSGGGLHVYSVNGITIEDVRVADCSYYSSGSSATYEGQGAGIKVYDATATFRNVEAINNTCTGYNCYGIGMDVLNGSSVVLQNVALIGNSGSTSSGTYGAAMYIDAGSSVDATNLIVAGNSASDSDGSAAAMAGIYVQSGELNVTNGTVVGNTSDAGLGGGRGAGIRASGSAASITMVNVTNSANTNTGGTTVGGGYAITSSASASFAYCNTYGNTPSDYSGISDPTGSGGNTTVDPMLADTSSTDPADWDLALDPSSPLIDAGDPSIVDPDCSVGDVGAFGGPAGAW